MNEGTVPERMKGHNAGVAGIKQ